MSQYLSYINRIDLKRRQLVVEFCDSEKSLEKTEKNMLKRWKRAQGYVEENTWFSLSVFIQCHATSAFLFLLI